MTWSPTHRMVREAPPKSGDILASNDPSPSKAPSPASRLWWLPAGLGAAVLLGHMALLYSATVRHTDGSFCYPLDDTFIHLAIAKTLANHGIFGITAQGFAGASSSIGWPLLLALSILTVGDHVLTPLILNALFATGLLVVLARWFEREAPATSLPFRSLGILGVVVLTPLSTIAFLGMEHSLHILAMVLLMMEATRALSSSDEAPRTARLAFYAALATSLRYESAFLAGFIAVLLAARGHRTKAASMLGIAALPPILFGVYSLRQGGSFLPNSVLVKGSKLHLHELSDIGDVLGGNIIHRIAAEPHMLALPLACAFLLVVSTHRSGAFSANSLRLSLSLLATLAHVQLASLNWFFRYEGYLIVTLWMSLMLYCGTAAPRFRAVMRGQYAGYGGAAAVVLAGFLIVGPLVRRSLQAFEFTPTASRNIYDQQVQSARFLGEFFPNEPVAVNDIGAVAYYTGQPVVDLAGLASLEIAKAKQYQMMRPPLAEDVARVTEGVSVAIVYDEWVPYRPTSWLLAGRWRIPVCRSCFAPSVSIYATKPEAIPRVVEALRQFTPRLPHDVTPEGLYMDFKPNAADYRLGDGDTVRVELPGFSQEDPVVQVGANGYVGLPFLADPLPARLHTLEELAREVDRAYAKVPTVQVQPSTVHLVEPRWARVAAVGNIRRTGEVWMATPPTVEYLIAHMGGLSRKADPSSPPYVYRRTGNAYARVDVSPQDRLDRLDILVVP